jgi:RNA polymerase sigma-70 factor (ECF subfamily)
MNRVDQATTRLSLLLRLSQVGAQDQQAWEQFVDCYGPMIYKWCRRWHLQDTDAKDVTQQVFLKLASMMATFIYDPSRSFRAWLRTLTHHAWQDLMTQQRRPGRGSGDSAVQDFLASTEAREDLLHRLDREFDLDMLETASARVRERVNPATWEAFRLTALEALPALEVAQRLNKRVATVYVARSKVQKMIQEEIQKLRD